ncbi:SMAD/FHA domain-containing protein [Rhizopus microsporus var. microsporus]|uniref:SMAD/FHA domain-containing protein n=2 Tax=Rhizopus microsporus TaxID=58291 RepID=A0A2G4SZE9_RHIZD|nr:SMAD/FHA domain-containing protein [Rhizopus microsporus ATCC 52813]ORE12161.1 SMAD/FHA domain-containing protein [Rhizopus microsporus var. microsporus]PHZ14150.1 SMAD/FHA domain-containing protein [Rhizopus microsporus ATCC 52813]
MPSPSRSYQRSRSPRRTRSRSPNRSRSPRDRRRRHSPPSPRRRHRPDQKDAPRQRRHEWGGRGASTDRKEEEEEPAEREGPNFGLSGKLAAETNTVKGVELKYNEPPEAAKPDKKWRLYVFKKDEQIDLLHIHRQSSYLIGRDRVVVDIPVDHPSCSKQHAVIQYREVDEKDESGKFRKVIKPFIIDLEATNGTFLNGEQIPTTRFIELKPQDVLKFGSSTRDYVLLHAEI